MRKIIGVSCIALGLLCLLAAAGFAVYNRWEEQTGEQAAQTILQDIRTHMEYAAAKTLPQTPLEGENFQESLPEPAVLQMQTVQVEGGECIGILAIPVLEVELPVLTDWSYEKLKKAPCHYYGSCYESDFVIAAHNYASHFGRLTQLQTGDLVLFTDVAGQTHYYEVVLLETLPPTATEEMITSGFALSLYTCTPGGGNRVTVRCNRVSK
jgi:sortase A